MGSRLDGFDVKLTFDADGKVSEIEYVDQEGCGHSAPFGGLVPIGHIVGYHLDHYRTSHRMEPPQMCKYGVETALGTMLRCVRERHGQDVTHRFEVPAT